jgi:hypothetical protein
MGYRPCTRLKMHSIRSHDCGRGWRFSKQVLTGNYSFAPMHDPTPFAHPKPIYWIFRRPCFLTCGVQLHLSKNLEVSSGKAVPFGSHQLSWTAAGPTVSSSQDVFLEGGSGPDFSWFLHRAIHISFVCRCSLKYIRSCLTIDRKGFHFNTISLTITVVARRKRHSSSCRRRKPGNTQDQN